MVKSKVVIEYNAAQHPSPFLRAYLVTREDVINVTKIMNLCRFTISTAWADDLHGGPSKQIQSRVQRLGLQHCTGMSRPVSPKGGTIASCSFVVATYGYTEVL